MTAKHFDVLSFPKPANLEYVATLPTEKEIADLYPDAKMKGVVTVILFDDDSIVHYMDGVDKWRAVGLMEDTKLEIFNTYDEDEEQ
jgi:hypothetical protein